MASATTRGTRRGGLFGEDPDSASLSSAARKARAFREGLLLDGEGDASDSSTEEKTEARTQLPADRLFAFVNRVQERFLGNNRGRLYSRFEWYIDLPPLAE